MLLTLKSPSVSLSDIPVGCVGGLRVLNFLTITQMNSMTKIAAMTAPTHMPTILGIPRASTLGGEVFRINAVSSVKYYLRLTCPGSYNMSVLSAVGHFVLCWGIFF